MAFAADRSRRKFLRSVPLRPTSNHTHSPGLQSISSPCEAGMTLAEGLRGLEGGQARSRLRVHPPLCLPAAAGSTYWPRWSPRRGST